METPGTTAMGIKTHLASGSGGALNCTLAADKKLLPPIALGCSPKAPHSYRSGSNPGVSGSPSQPFSSETMDETWVEGQALSPDQSGKYILAALTGLLDLRILRKSWAFGHQLNTPCSNPTCSLAVA